MSDLVVEFFTRVNYKEGEPDLWSRCEEGKAEWAIESDNGEFVRAIYLGNPDEPIYNSTQLPYYLKNLLNSKENKKVNNLTEALSHTRLLIDKGAYEKEIEEPTPLEKKCLLVSEVKEMFVEDLLSQGVHVESITLAWDIAEAEIGADEALNEGFLYSVLNYIQDLEDYYLKRRQADKNCAYWE